jgi:hypothetical protein
VHGRLDRKSLVAASDTKQRRGLSAFAFFPRRVVA